MWPFSTIRDLKLELEQAERSNTKLRQTIHDHNTEWRRSYADVCQETRREKDVLQTRINSLYGKWRDCQNKLAAAHITLSGAMVRDPKTGRMTRWIDQRKPASVPDVTQAYTYFENIRGEAAWKLAHAALGEEADVG